MEWLQHLKKSQCSWSSIVCKNFLWVSDLKQNNFEDLKSNQIGKDTTRDSSTPWRMKIWWSMPSDAWPWWFLNPHENLRRKVMDWWVFWVCNQISWHLLRSSQIFSGFQIWQNTHLRTGDLLSPILFAARNFVQIPFTSQTCPQRQNSRNSHDAVQAGKPPWLSTCVSRSEKNWCCSVIPNRCEPFLKGGT